MKRLEQLPQIADQALGGLNADEAMKQRILAAAGSKQPVRRNAWVPALCASLALAVAVGAGVPMLTRPDTQDEPLIQTISAGNSDTVGNENTLGSLTNESVNVGGAVAIPTYRSIWAPSNGGSFPMIGIDGRYYRMLTSPSEVPASLLGARIGEVQEYTTEPALTGSGVIMSNQAPSGTTIYEIRGMGSTLVSAEVSGSYRLFQRVSFNGSALRGSESLADTLQCAGHITMMELSGVGIVANSADCEQLFSILCSSADFASSGSISSQQNLLIELDNGLTVQLAVKNDKIGACGVWTCPEFFDAFAEKVQ